MGLFHQNFDKPGPGVSPDAPRKKGAARFFEILGRDFSTIWMAGLLALISSLPFALLLWFAVSTHSLIPMLAAGILGGMIAAPQIVGQSVVPAVAVLVALILLAGIAQYIYAQVALVEVSFGGLLKNALMLFLGYLPRSALGVLWQGIYWAAVALLWPVSSFAVILCSLWLPCLLNLMAIYPALDKSFDLEKTIKAMRDAQLNSENEDK